MSDEILDPKLDAIFTITDLVERHKTKAAEAFLRGLIDKATEKLRADLATEREKTSQWWETRAELDRVTGLLATERTARESLEKERDGLAAQIAAVNALVGLEQEGCMASERLASEISVVLEDSALDTLAVHDASLTAPLERRVAELTDALRDLVAEDAVYEAFKNASRCGWCGITEGDPHAKDCAWIVARAALASTPREGTEEPKS